MFCCVACPERRTRLLAVAHPQIIKDPTVSSKAVTDTQLLNFVLSFFQVVCNVSGRLFVDDREK